MQAPENKRAASAFTTDMRYKNVNVWFVLQNLRKQGPSMRDIVLDCPVFLLLRSPRDVVQIKLLARQTSLKCLGRAHNLSSKETYISPSSINPSTTHEPQACVPVEDFR